MASVALEVGQRLLGVVKAHAGMSVGVGIALIVAGVLSISAPSIAGLSLMLVLGGLMLVGGIALGLLALRVGAFEEGVSLFLMSVLMLLAGLYTISRPAAALASMTVLLTAYFIVSGVIELVAGFRARPAPGSGWIMASAVVTLLLGILLWAQFPFSGAWAIGTLFGSKLVMTGATMTSIGMTVRQEVGGMEKALES